MTPLRIVAVTYTGHSPPGLLCGPWLALGAYLLITLCLLVFLVILNYLLLLVYPAFLSPMFQAILHSHTAVLASALQPPAYTYFR